MANEIILYKLMSQSQRGSQEYSQSVYYFLHRIRKNVWKYVSKNVCVSVV